MAIRFVGWRVGRRAARVARIRASKQPHERRLDLRRRVDAGAPVQQQPHHLHVALSRRQKEACGTILRRPGSCAGPAVQGRSGRGRVATTAVCVKEASDRARLRVVVD